ncbi:MAG TPA: NAD-dependent epimerase/dehydratase family protein [Anaerolineales bacterium]|nr:NAD-dependent epimerase/dehydratase family protein [Anaerolineales bacterium]
MANYLVTGAAGFIGSRLAEVLLEQGHTVTGVDNLNDAYDVRMKDFRLRKLQAIRGFTFLRADISDRTILDANSTLAGQKFEAVINLAARAGVRASVENPWVFYESNVLGTLNLLELCRQRGIPKFLTASTAGVYGDKAPRPTSEEADSNHPLQPYAASKKASEVLAHSYHALYGLDVTVVRYFNVYGPAPRPDMVIFRFAKWITEGQPVELFGDGEQSRGFTYLDDIVSGTLAALKPLGYEIINLGGHQPLNLIELIRILEKLIGKKARVNQLPANPADIRASLADVEKAKRILGWQPQVGLEEGIGRLVDWYNAERDWARETVKP